MRVLEKIIRVARKFL